MTDTPEEGQVQQPWPAAPPPPGYSPQYPPPGYQAPYPPPPPYGYAPNQRVNGMAIASMVLGIVWVYWIGSILALVFGYVAKKQIAESRGAQSGNGMAIAGIVLGWVGVGIFALIILVALISAASE